MAQPRRSRAKNQPKKQAKTEAEEIAALYVQARSTLVRAGRALHDQVGSSLSAAGVQLQLLRMDVPAAQARIDETLGVLEQTLGQVRDLSQQLCPSPAYRGGLKQALLRLADQYAGPACGIDVQYTSTVVVPAEIAAALADAAGVAVERALLKGARRVSVTVKGTGRLDLTIADDGRKAGRARALSAVRTIAGAQGLAFECTTGRGTIVSIRYAIRRTSRG